MLRLLACSGAAFAAMISSGQAGPCEADIGIIQGRIDAKLEAIAAAGPFMREGAFAGMSDQPTPRSIAAAEVRSGELSAQKVAAVRQAMARARAADAAGDGRACEKALAKVRRVLGP
jgi:hypothetical protein